MTVDDAGMIGREASTEQFDADENPVTAHRSSPERTVFTEQGNTDAWISTDTVVGLER